MDSDSELNFSPKQEADSDSDNSSNRNVVRDEKNTWSQDRNTFKLLKEYENCRELWDLKHPMNKDRAARNVRLEYLAGVFGTSVEEINRKLHNLRTQFCHELRKIKRKRAAAVAAGTDVAGVGSGWEYFDTMASFLLPPASDDPLDITVDGVNLELAEFQANEDEVYRSRTREPAITSTCCLPSASGTTGQATGRGPRFTKTARISSPGAPSSAPLPMILNPSMWDEEPMLSGRPSISDEAKIFGEFVASELRSLRSESSRKRMKRMIQKAILQVGEEEDHLSFAR